MTSWGADVEALDSLAGRFTQSAAVLERCRTAASRAVAELRWKGADFEAFGSDWDRHGAVLYAAIEALRQAANEIRRHAREQRDASAATASDVSAVDPARSALRPRVLSRETYSVTSKASLLIFGIDNAATVIKEQLSDGTYRVTVVGEGSASAGFDLEKALGNLGVEQDIASLGLNVGSGAAYSYVFRADDDASASELVSQLQGRASSITNRTVVGGGLDRSEVTGLPALRDPGISLESVTQLHLGATVDGHGSLAEQGVSVNASRWNETTIDVAAGTRTDRTVFEATAGHEGWDQSSEKESYAVEIVRSVDGSPREVVISRSFTDSVDTRGGGEKVRDLVLGIVPGVNYANEEAQTSTSTTTQSYNLDALPSDHPVRQMALVDDRAGLRDWRVSTGGDPSVAAVTNETYVGEQRSATRGLLGQESTTERSFDTGTK